MTAIRNILVTPSAAADAYAKAARSSGVGSSLTEGSFGATMQQALQQAVEAGHNADAQATQALQGGGNLTDVVVALSHAEMTLQTATAIRDRMVQAYQDIIKMPI